MWKWMDGSDFNYTNWHAGEPNNGVASVGEYYIEVGRYWQAPNTWNDIFGAQKLPYVCKCTEK